MPEPLVISSSMLGAYIDCKKRFQLGFEKNLEPITGEGPMQRGTDFHRYAEWNSRVTHKNLADRSTQEQIARPPQVSQQTVEVFNAWWEHRGHQKEESKKLILGVETPIFTPLSINTTIPGQKVYLRCTFDQIYLDKDGWIVGLDYKTVVKMDSWDVEIDFQGRLYIAALRNLFPDYDVRFEYERIRQVPPGTPRGESQNLRFIEGEWWQYNAKGDKRKRAELWTVDECYDTIDLVCSDAEITELWNETLFNVNEMIVRREVAKQMPGAYGRSTNKMICKLCYFKELCKADLEGTLDEDTIRMIARSRNPMTLPETLETTQEQLIEV